MLGAALVLGGGQVAADEPSASNDIKVVVTQTADEDAPTKAQEGTKESITTPATEVSATESKTEEVTPEKAQAALLQQKQRIAQLSYLLTQQKKQHHLLKKAKPKLLAM